MSKPITIEERKTRLLRACYLRIIEDEQITRDLELLDALQDVLNYPGTEVWEWSITKTGGIRFQ